MVLHVEAGAEVTKRRGKKRERFTEDVRLARSILPEGQARPGVFITVDKANHSDMVRSGERKTIRRRPKLDTEPIRKLLSPQQLAVCLWYAEAHAARYDTLGITAQWGGGASSGRKDYCHWPKTRQQEDALANFDYAREGIAAELRPLFERVVIHQRPLGRMRLTFRLAAQQLLERIEGRVELGD